MIDETVHGKPIGDFTDKVVGVENRNYIMFFVYVYIYMYMYIYICIHMYIYVYIHIIIHIHIYRDIFAYLVNMMSTASIRWGYPEHITGIS